MRIRRTKFEIQQDLLLQDRIKNLQRLITDPSIIPVDREKFHRQLASLRARQTRVRKQREAQRRQREIEAAEKARRAKRAASKPIKHADRSPEEIAAMPEQLRKVLYGTQEIETSESAEPAPVEQASDASGTAEPKPEPQPRRSSFDPLMPEPQDAEKARQWVHRLMMSWSGVAVLYQLPNGQVVTAEGFPFLGSMAVLNGQRVLQGGTPAALYAVTEDPIPGAVFWHGAYFAPEHKQRVVAELTKGWTLPALVPDDTDPLPTIALTRDEAALNQEIRSEEIRRAMRPEAAYDY